MLLWKYSVSQQRRTCPSPLVVAIVCLCACCCMCCINMLLAAVPFHSNVSYCEPRALKGNAGTWALLLFTNDSSINLWNEPYISACIIYHPFHSVPKNTRKGILTVSYLTHCLMTYKMCAFCLNSHITLKCSLAPGAWGIKFRTCSAMNEQVALKILIIQ